MSLKDKILAIHWNNCEDCRCEPMISSKGAGVSLCKEAEALKKVRR